MIFAGAQFSLALKSVYFPKNPLTISTEYSYLLKTYQLKFKPTKNFQKTNSRYWSYIQPARADQSRFWLELMLARMLFIFLFQNVVWAAVRTIELLCDSTPKFVKERSELILFL